MALTVAQLIPVLIKIQVHRQVFVPLGFTVGLHVMQRTVLPRSFCPSVSLSVSVKGVLCDKTKETCAHILTPHEKSLILVF